MLIDSHCHLNSLSPSIQDEVFLKCSQGYLIIASSTNYESALGALEFSNRYPFVYACLGFHPFWVNEYSADTIKKYEQLIVSNKKVVAIGEIGLDYKAKEPLRKQEDILRQFIRLAKKHNLPILIHNRLDNLRILEVIDEFFASYRMVVFHCFSSGKDVLAKITNKGGFVSFSLNILRRRPHLIDALRACPIDNILLETDSPYMKIDDRPSSPLDIGEVYSFAAGIKNIKESELEESVSLNAERVFELSKKR